MALSRADGNSIVGLRKTSVLELQAILAELGVNPGDVVMIHSAVFTLGIVEDGLAGLYRAFRSELGPDGTLIVPTFTYSFRRSEIFDVRNTPSPKVLGAFSEFVRREEGAVRSPDPLFSMAAVGPEAEDLMRRPSNRCFGEGSIYERLFARNMLILALGITYDTGISAFMHLERLANVEYRRDLLLQGTTVGVDRVAYADSAVHFERNVERFPDGRRNRIPFGLEMERKGISSAIEYGSGRHVAIRSKPFEAYTLEQLNRDPWAMFMRNDG